MDRSRRARALRALIAALSIACALGACGDAPAKRARTIVLISVDTLRPGRLGVYGNTAEVSPAIDALARDAVVFEAARSPAPWTLPAHMSMLTGLDPVAHDVFAPDKRLSAAIPTLAERLARAGYRTASYTDGGYVGALYGFARGFEVSEEAHTAAERGLARSVPRAVRWLGEHAGEDCFLFLHTFDVHAPYDEGDPAVLAEFRRRPAPDGPLDWLLFRAQYLVAQVASGVARYGRLAELLDDYDAGVHEADVGIGRLLEALRASGRFEDALVIVTSDHGESFLDHGEYVGHGIGLTDDEIAVPLLVKLPRGAGAGTRRKDLVDLLDLAPTVLECAQIAPDPTLEGESLAALVRGEPRARASCFSFSSATGRCGLVRDGFKFLSAATKPAERTALNHLGPTLPEALEDAGLMEYELAGENGMSRLRYDVEHDPLGVFDQLAPEARLFDLRGDPAERDDQRLAHADLARSMADELRARVRASSAIAAAAGDAGAVQHSAADQRELAQLGYVAPAPSEPRGSEAAVQVLDEPPHRKRAAQTPLDTGDLERADREVHALRLALRDGKLDPERARATLEDAARAYAAWSTSHPEGSARSRWRLYEAGELARRAGIALDPSTWTSPASAQGTEQR